ncbi:hypothetical protein HGG82_06930 [Marinomonas sp. M1K-6]|uniref:Uncharacterized protein n=1 Tax=Marinomonas profundi TaxID=2726122 RepID=A0A847RAU6_9GAMM|nr:hypothetical protein [Marinomonas profundi]NLQ17360.1 hypothetical protein [Marinomonas profundi]UDV01888.1 hypothetical protein J8N69_09710 [Marinomonas profundi]
MPIRSSYMLTTALANAKTVGGLGMMNMTHWWQHYQAETVDLRYFFHSGWSS